MTSRAHRPVPHTDMVVEALVKPGTSTPANPSIKTRKGPKGKAFEFKPPRTRKSRPPRPDEYVGPDQHGTLLHTPEGRTPIAKTGIKSVRLGSPPRCSKTNPNLCVLIPWMPMWGWSLEEVYQLFLQSPIPVRRNPEHSLSWVSVRQGRLWWDYRMHSEREILVARIRRPKRFSPPSADTPTFECEVCGRWRSVDDSTHVRAGANAYLAEDYMVCDDCIRARALERSTRAGYYVRVIAG